MNVLQLISTAGGLLEYADEKDIIVMRTENGKTGEFTSSTTRTWFTARTSSRTSTFKPGDTVVVP